MGDLIDDVPAGRLIRRDEQARRSLAMGDAEHLLLSSGDERRFHVTESHIPPGGSAGEELYTLPADVELVYVLSGSLELQVGDETARARAGRHAHATRRATRTRGGTRRRRTRRSCSGPLCPIHTSV